MFLNEMLTALFWYILCMVIFNVDFITQLVMYFVMFLYDELFRCYSISLEWVVVVYVFVSLADWLTGYEILAFEKPCLHYQKISTESRFGVNGNEPIESLQLYMGYSLKKLERRLGLN